MRLLVIIHSTLSISPSSAQDTKARELYAQSIRLFGERKATEAIPFMEQAIKQDPNFTDAYIKLGQLYEFTKRYDPALAAYRNAIRLQPDSPASGAAYQSLSSTLLRLGRSSLMPSGQSLRRVAHKCERRGKTGGVDDTTGPAAHCPRNLRVDCDPGVTGPTFRADPAGSTGLDGVVRAAL